jgi:hypothetical protein
MSKIENLQQDLLARVQAIGAPLASALRDGRNDDDGDEPATPVDREIVAVAMRRLLALCVDIEEGLYRAETGDA